MSNPQPLDSRCGDCLVLGALQGLPDGLVLVDRGGRVFHVNRKAEDLLGIKGRQILGTRLAASLSHPGLAAFWYSVDQDSDPVTADLQLGAGTFIQATVSTCRSASGDVLGKALMLRDVTREKRINVELSASLAERLMEMAGGQETPPDLPNLTRREREILQLLADGLTNAAIASRLNVSVNTVASHLKHLYPKIRVTSRSQAAAYAVSHGLYRPESPL